MGKLKLKLGSGSVVEKPLINAFLENGSTYVVLDNELNGSMGLPIILVSKLDGDKLVKIVDQSEWQLVKEYLKNVIAGNKVEFVKLNSEVNADDLYYTQLTLPVPSFDALKKSYAFKDKEGEENPVASSINNASNVTDIPINISPEANTAPVETTPVAPAPVAAPVAPTPEAPVANPQMPEVPVAPAQEVAPVVETPAVPVVDITTPLPGVTSAPVTEEVNLDNPLMNNLNTPVSEPPVVNTPEVVPSTGVEKEPEITPTPIIETNIPEPVKESVFKEQKEAFMQACENMFDALVQKFEKELESKK